MSPLALLLACGAPPEHGAAAPAGKAQATAWQPGDPIPGWDDADCTIEPDFNVLRVRGLDAWRVVGALDDRSGLADVAALTIELRDCTRFPCSEGERPPGDPYSEFQVATELEEGVARGLGWYGPDGDLSRPVVADVYGAVGWAHNEEIDGAQANTHARVCISRARPDQVSGVVQYVLYRFADPYPFYWYTTLVLWSSFEVTLADHAGVEVAADASASADIDTLPEDIRRHHWRYRGVSYDEAWPWEEITDPDVREAVYERYRPTSLE